MIWMLEHLKMSWRFLSLSSFFQILVSEFCSGWMFLSSFWSTPLIWFPVSFPSLLVPCIFLYFKSTFSFISLSIAFIFSSNFVTIFNQIWEHPDYQCLNCACDRLPISSSLSYIFSGALICSFIWAIYFFGVVCLVRIRGGALGVHQGRATLVAVLWCCMWGRGPRGNNATCSPLCWISVTSPATHNQIGPWVVISGGWVCVRSRTLWVSPTNSPVRLGVSPTAASIPTGIFSQRFQALFPCAGTLGCTVCLAS